MRYLVVILCFLSVYGHSREIVKDSTYFREKLVFAQALFDEGSDSAVAYTDRIIRELMETDGLEHFFPGVYLLRGDHYSEEGDYARSLDEYHHSLDYSQDLRDSILIAQSNSSIASVLLMTGRHKDALEKYIYNLKFWQRRGRAASEVKALVNVHECLTAMNLHGEALAYGFTSIEKSKKLGDKKMIGITHYRVALSYYRLSKMHPQHKFTYLNSAVYYIREALRLAWVAGTPKEAMEREILYGHIENGLGEYDKGIEHCMLAKGTDIGMEERDMYTEACECLAYGLKAKGKYNEAYTYYAEYSHLKDSLRKANNALLVSRKELQHSYEREKLADSLHNQMVVHEIQAEHDQQANMQRIYILIALVLAGLAFFFSVYVYRDYQRKKNINVQLAEYNREIMDSIGYAKRIQEAILPPEHFIREHLPNHFILYKPKDIVAGDFYWMEKQDDCIIIAAADCTGHGVPGALVSVICYNALNRAVREFDLRDPGRILDKVRELVVETFQSNFGEESEIKDGMDIAMCRLNLKTREMEYAGANNPLWILRDGEQDMEILKANRQPIGRIDNPEPFTTQRTKLKEGDLIYLFTDGFADQFGGNKGKKMRYKPFRDILANLSKESLENQLEKMDKIFEDWRGDLEQLDDVCVIGVRV